MCSATGGFEGPGTELATEEARYVTETVLPGYVGSALEKNPVVTQAVLPAAAVSATITFGQDRLLRALVSAVSVTKTFGLGPVGAMIGEALVGPPGVFPGYVIGDRFGIGPTVSWKPETNTVYVGLTAVVSPGWSGGNGWRLSVYPHTPGLDPHTILNGWSGSVNIQRTGVAGVVFTKSPGQPVISGYSAGTRNPIGLSGGYSLCLLNCP